MSPSLMKREFSAQAIQSQADRVRKDFIDQTNSNLPKFSEEKKNSKLTDSSWLNEDKVKELQIKITPYKKAKNETGNSREIEDSLVSKNSLPPKTTERVDAPESLQLFKSEQFDTESKFILDIIQQENQKVDDEDKPENKEAKEPVILAKVKSETLFKEDDKTLKPFKKGRIERSPIHKKSNMKNLLLKINPKLKKEPINVMKQKSPKISKTREQRKRSSVRNSEPEGFSSSESSSESDSSRSSSVSSTSSDSSNASSSS